MDPTDFIEKAEKNTTISTNFLSSFLPPSKGQVMPHKVYEMRFVIKGLTKALSIYKGAINLQS
jgi:hypothetical protein